MISDNARIFGDAQIFDNAWVFHNAHIYDNARVYDNARIYEDALVYGNAWVCDSVRVYGNAQIFDDARVYGIARIYGNAEIYEAAYVYDDTRISDNALIYGNARVCGNARVYGDAWVRGNSIISQNQYVSYGIVKTDLSRPKNLVKSIKAQCNLLAIDNKVIAYKLVRPDLTSFYDKNFHYEVGKEIEVKDCEESNRSCASGLHFSNPIYWEKKCGNEEYVYLEAEINLDDIITVQQGKIRCRKAKILRSFSLN